MDQAEIADISSCDVQLTKIGKLADVNHTVVGNLRPGYVQIDQVFEVYRHWENSTKFSSAIVEAHDLPPDENGRAQFYIRNRGCVLFFCQSFERQGYLETELNREVRAIANPDTSDFHHSNESWRFAERDGGTVVTYDLSMAPKFWIPPGIGPYLIKRKLKNNGDEAVDRIELIAQGIDRE